MDIWKIPSSTLVCVCNFRGSSFSSMLGYFANYRQILLQADQKSYKVQRITQGAIIVKTIIQIVGMQIVAWPFVFWTIMELGFAIFSAYILNYVLKKNIHGYKQEITMARIY